MTAMTKCGTCDQAEHEDDQKWGEGCLNGTVYGYCSSENCYAFCEDHGQCQCDCHERDDRGWVIGQKPDRPSVWP